MHPVAHVALKLIVMRRLVGICVVAFGLPVGDAQIHGSPSDLIVAAVFVTLKTEVHLVAGLFQRLLVVAAEVGDGVVDLLIEAVIVTVCAGNIAGGVSACEDFGRGH